MSDVRKVVVVLGGRREEGNSATLAAELIRGAWEAGAMVERFYLHGMTIRPCRACQACQESSDKDCAVDDDMKMLYPRLRAADALVIASPIYWFTVSAQTKLFMDRCYALGGPDGHALAGKDFGIILTYADSDPFTSGAVNAMRTFQDACRFLGARIAGMVYGSASEAGEIKSNRELMDKAYELGKKLACGT
ncbi:MAG: flavodoxin family protein [Chloroflexi bacterium]|nr:flavodoxin family protein [Chloroflexota bacterium]